MKKMEILTNFFLKIPFVFHGLYVREDLDVHAIVAAHKAIGFKDKSQYEKNCPMQVPGFNTQGADNCKARFGWCWNTFDQGCKPDVNGADSDNSMGLGLYSRFYITWPVLKAVF